MEWLDQPLLCIGVLAAQAQSYNHVFKTKNAPETSRKQVTSQQFKHIVDWFFQTTLKIQIREACSSAM